MTHRPYPLPCYVLDGACTLTSTLHMTVAPTTTLPAHYSISSAAGTLTSCPNLEAWFPECSRALYQPNHRGQLLESDRLHSPPSRFHAGCFAESGVIEASFIRWFVSSSPLTTHPCCCCYAELRCNSHRVNPTCSVLFLPCNDGT